MNVSVIIPSYNGERKLPKTLDALSRQHFSEFECILVIDGSTDASLTVAQSFENKFHNFRVIYQQNKGRAAVRNRGAAEAVGELLIFYDDDMIPEPDSVGRHIEFHSQKLVSSILCGNPVEASGSQNSDIQNYRLSLTEKWTAHFAEGINVINMGNLFLTASNFSLPRSLFMKLGGFDERLNDAEDKEFGYRALLAGVPLFFDKSNRAIHNEKITCKSYIERMRQYTIGQQRLVGILPDSLRSIYRISILKKTFYWLFSFTAWVALIDNYRALYFLPKPVRFKIYDWVTFSQGVVFLRSKSPGS